MKRHPALLIALILPSTTVIAVDHQLSVDFSQSENYVGSQEPLTRMKPDIIGLGYGATFEEQFGINVSFWTGEDETGYPDNDYTLEQESSGASLSLAWYQEQLGLNLVFSRSTTDNTLKSPTRPAQAEQEQEFREWYFAADYTWHIGNFEFRPELGVGKQTSKTESVLNTETRFLERLDSEQQEDTGKYLQMGLMLSYWLEQNPATLWRPGLSLYWLNPISGTSSLAQQRSVSSGRFKRKASDQTEEDDESDASGYADLSLSLYIKDFSFSAYFSRSFEAKPDTESIGVSLGYGF